MWTQNPLNVVQCLDSVLAAPQLVHVRTRPGLAGPFTLLSARDPASVFTFDALKGYWVTTGPRTRDAGLSAPRHPMWYQTSFQHDEHDKRPPILPWAERTAFPAGNNVMRMLPCIILGMQIHFISTSFISRRTAMDPEKQPYSQSGYRGAALPLSSAVAKSQIDCTAKS